jgi:hypothetical protein
MSRRWQPGTVLRLFHHQRGSRAQAVWGTRVDCLSPAGSDDTVNAAASLPFKGSLQSPVNGAPTQLVGELTLHGVTRPLAVNAAVALDPAGGLTARGTFSLKQTDFGIEPVTAAGGTVRVKDVIGVDFVLRAR